MNSPLVYQEENTLLHSNICYAWLY